MRRLVLIALVLAAMPARAAELLMFETDACAWCLKWHREVGHRYATTKAGRLLPLQRIDMTQPVPAGASGVKGVRFTPTFVLMDCGREVGRIVGYTTEPAFWSELTTAVGKWQAAKPQC